MARQIARQFCRLGEVHSLVYGRRASGENGRKLTASTRVGSESRLMDYLGSTSLSFYKPPSPYYQHVATRILNHLFGDAAKQHIFPL